MKRLGILTLAGLAALAGATQAQRVEAGLVDSIAGPRGGLRVYRSGKWETLSRLQPVYVGDSVVAGDSGTRARIRLYGRTAQWVCAGTSAARPCRRSLTVRTPARGGGLGVAVRGLLQNALHPLIGGASWTRKVSTIGRGDDEIVVPLLGASPEVGAGNRLLEVAWLGGKPPFTVRVVKDGVGAIRGAEDLTGQAASLGRLALTPGEYGLRIADFSGASRQIRFRVVPVAELPKPPAEYDAPELSGGARTIIAAAWLAGQRDGRWAWEAYLRLATLSGDETALRLRAELAAGRLPPAEP